MALEYPIISEEASSNSGGNAELNNIFPVGSIQITTGIDPNTYLPGNWTEVGQGKTLFGVDPNDTDFTPSGKTGGEKEHTLTINEIPAHAHGVSSHSHTIPAVDIARSGEHTHSGIIEESIVSLESSTTEPDGGHSHSGSTDTNSHRHSIQLRQYDNAHWEYNSGTTKHLVTNPGDTILQEAIELSYHNHSITLNSVGDHTHEIQLSGGEHTHNIDISIESHTHTVPEHSTDVSGYSVGGETGDGDAHSNIPPYLVVHFWKRIS